MRRLILMAAALASGLGVSAVGGAQAAPSTRLAAGTLSVDLTAAVKPERLPKRGDAPATLTVRGTVVSPTDRTQLPTLRSVELRLDRQLTLDARGLATCATSDLSGIVEAQARKRCGQALVGTGTLDTENTFPETPPAPYHYRFLLFNAKAAKLLVYTNYARAATVASGTASRHTLRIPMPTLPFSGTTGFRVRIGRSWRDQGQLQSYLSGQCRTGQLSNRATLQFSPNATLSGAVADSCLRG